MRRKITVLGLIVCLMLLGVLTALASEKPMDLNISAAISLKDALNEIQKIYQSKNPNVNIVYNFGSSGSLQTQIEQGAPCDLFISAATKQMDALDKEGLIKKSSRRNVVKNQLVLIVPKDSTQQISDFKDLAKDGVKKIGVGEPKSVPAGQYAQESFKFLGLWDKLQEKLVYGSDVRSVLTYVESGNVDAGIVYKTDALISSKVKVVAVAPADSHEAILYPGAIIANAKNSSAAEKFLAFLSSSEAKTIFEKYGFMLG